jgi:hypothetical protein
MGSTEVIQRRVPLSAVVAIGLLAGFTYGVDSAELTAQAFQGVTEEQLRRANSRTVWTVANYFFSWVSWFGAAFAIVSLLNVIIKLLTAGGVSDQVVGVVGGVFFWFGADTVNLILIPLAIEELTLEWLRVEVLGIGAVLTLLGMALMVKG